LNLPDIPTIDELLRVFNSLVENIASEIRDKGEDRAPGGIQRAYKGELVEALARGLIKRAWVNLNGNIADLKTEKGKIVAPLKEDYLKRIKDKWLIDHITKNIAGYKYTFKIDVPVYVRGKLALAVECKAYAENAMMKRILLDGSFIKKAEPAAEIVLFQLESQLGGDYADIFKRRRAGSASTHTLMSYFDYDLHIVTLLEGERHPKRPIHAEPFFKPLKRKSLENALNFFTSLLKKHR